jgi:hypothetical protein
MFAFKLSFILFLTKVIYLIFYANSIKFAKTGKQTNMKLSEEDHKIVENLMTADSEKLKSLIKQLENQNSEAVTSVLTIIWQLNPDEEIRSTAKEKLEKNLDFKQLANKNKCFELFRSLNEVLPWSNAQAVEIQQSNFAVFKKNLPHYEMLLAKYHTYSEIVLDAGRKLLLIFNLEEEAKFCFEIIVKHGISNDEEEQKELENVGTLKSVISQIRTINTGESVGYGRRFVAEKTTKIATIPIGYADGISRSWGQGVGYVLINNKPAEIIGSICMDMLMVDITHIDCKEGNAVIIFGENPTVNFMAKQLNTISYEILTSISQRVKRVFFRE